MINPWLAFAVLVAGLGMSVPAVAGPVEDGQAAYDRGDYTNAVKWYRKAADLGHAGAQNALGLMYAKGKGVMRNDREAVKLVLLAAERGDAAAQRNMGTFFANGLGVSRNYWEAESWYRKAAMQGEALAQRDIAFLYAEGKGVLQDYIQAHKWWNLAAGQGVKSAIKSRDLIAQQMTSAQIAEAHNTKSQKV